MHLSQSSPVRTGTIGAMMSEKQLKHFYAVRETRTKRGDCSLYPDRGNDQRQTGIGTMPQTAPEHRRHHAPMDRNDAGIVDPRRRDGYDVSHAPRTTLDQMMAMEMA